LNGLEIKFRVAKSEHDLPELPLLVLTEISDDLLGNGLSDWVIVKEQYLTGIPSENNVGEIILNVEASDGFKKANKEIRIKIERSIAAYFMAVLLNAAAIGSLAYLISVRSKIWNLTSSWRYTGEQLEVF